MTYPPAYDRVNFRGFTLDQITKHALLDVEARLGYQLTITQGSYNAGRVSASAGTHDGGGVVDLAPYDHERKVRALRSVGFAAWYRPELPGTWGPHIHAVLIGHDRLAPAAARQVEAYYAGRDGLASNRVDNTWRPSPIPVYKYPPVYTRGANVDHAIGDTKKAIRRNASKPVRLRKLRAALDALRSIAPRRKY